MSRFADWRMRIYTKTGDQGDTGLLGGARVRKDEPRVAAYGAVDELNAALGLAVASITGEALASLLRRVQSDLFVVGADVASPGGAGLRVGLRDVERLEQAIDRVEADLPPLGSFILPGGSMASASLHVARTICRRAERECVAAARVTSVNPDVLRYLNRLSDLLFVLARLANRLEGVDDILWQANKEVGDA